MQYIRTAFALCFLPLSLYLIQAHLGPQLGQNVTRCDWQILITVVLAGVTVRSAGADILFRPENAAIAIVIIPFVVVHISRLLADSYGPSATAALVKTGYVAYTLLSIGSNISSWYIGIALAYLIYIGVSFLSITLPSLNPCHIGLITSIVLILARSSHLSSRWLKVYLSIVLLCSTAIFKCRAPFAYYPHQISSSETLLQSAQSNTGWLSVIEDRRLGYRLLKNDHSVLGGYWMSQKESIFSAFYLQECVRLTAGSSSATSSATSSCLVIGLGVGVCVNALVSHGINVTVLELDPLVLEMSRTWFGLTSKAQFVTIDATDYLRQNHDAHFDYVIHDIFTGGGVAEQLFTVESWKAVNRIMSPNGVLAVNFVSAPSDMSLIAVTTTLRSVFAACEVISDKLGNQTMNMVIFCTKQGAVHFRIPNKRDFLGSEMRRRVFTSLNSHRIEVPTSNDSSFILSHQNPIKLKSMTRRLAEEHWHAMRKMIPTRKIWESY